MALPNYRQYSARQFSMDFPASSDCKEWHPYILNDMKSVENLSVIDSTLRTFESSQETSDWVAKVHKEYKVLRKWRPTDNQSFRWSTEQKEYLKCLRANKGRMLCISGPAGTGKSTLMAHTVAFYHRLGYHVIFNASANPKIEEFVERMSLTFGESIPFVRVAARWAKDSKDDNLDEDPDSEQDDFKDGEILKYLRSALKSYKRGDECSREHDLYHLTVRAAREQKLFDDYKLETPDDDGIQSGLSESGEVEASKSQSWTLGDNVTDDTPISTDPLPKIDDLYTVWSTRPEQDPDTDLPLGWDHRFYHGASYYTNNDRQITRSDPRSPKFSHNIWQLFRAGLDRLEAMPVKNWEYAGLTYDELDEDAQQLFQSVSRQCIKYVLARHRVVCTTPSMSADALMRDVFASGNYRSEPCIGMVIIKEEGANDTEADLWKTIVHGQSRNMVKLVIVCGDPQQLRPVFVGSGRFRPSHSQLSRCFHTRWMMNGGPHVKLLEQNRMHQAMLDALGRTLLYDREHRASKSRTKTLEHDLPGITKHCMQPLFKEFDKYNPKDRDALYRVQGIEIQGNFQMNEATKSKYNPAQLKFAMEEILPRQISYFGKETFANCLWIAGYGEMVKRIEDEFYEHMKTHQLSRLALPEVLTIDSSYGREAEWVVMFSVVDRAECGSDLGFMADDNRVVVAMTRAKNIFHLIHGRMYGGLEGIATNRYEVGADGKRRYLLLCYIQTLRLRRDWW